MPWSLVGSEYCEWGGSLFNYIHITHCIRQWNSLIFGGINWIWKCNFNCEYELGVVPIIQDIRMRWKYKWKILFSDLAGQMFYTSSIFDWNWTVTVSFGWWAHSHEGDSKWIRGLPKIGRVPEAKFALGNKKIFSELYHIF